MTQRPTPKAGILDIAQYVPGKSRAAGGGEPVKLSSNENILGASAAARAAYAAARDDIHLYPDGRAAPLREAICARFGLEPERLILGAGTDEVFGLINQVYVEPGGNIVQGQYGFGAYAIGARANQGQVKLAPEPDHVVTTDGLLAQVDGKTRVVFVANPANPTGTYMRRDEIARLHAGLRPDVLLVLDGAYGEFVTDPEFDDGLELARAADNVVVTHTFSKIHGLAGLRVGWAYCPAEVAAALDRVRLPFNVSIPAQRAAVAALADEAHVAASRDHVARWRPWMENALEALGLEVIRGGGNFVLIGFDTLAGQTAAEAESFLSERGLIVRGVAGYGLPNHLRITVGLEAHNRALIEALGAYLAAVGGG